MYIHGINVYVILLKQCGYNNNFAHFYAKVNYIAPRTEVICNNGIRCGRTTFSMFNK